MPHILIVKTSSLGDVVHNLPVLADIRAHWPQARFDWVVEEGFAEIPAMHPAVDRVIPVAMRRWRKAAFSGNTWRDIAACRAALKTTPYDLILDTQGLLKSALIARQAQGILHGQDRASAREPLAAAFYDIRHTVPRGQHAVVRNRQLAALALGYALPGTAPEYGLTPQPAATDPAMPKPYVIGLHATSRDSKLWPVEHWIALGQALHSEGRSLLLPWGNPAEQQRAERIAAAVTHARVLPRMGLSALAALMAGAEAAVGVDTGLAHLAAAVGIPVVAIYTDTDPQLTGVMAGRAVAINLGGIGRIPQPSSVLDALNSERTLTSPGTD